MVTADEMDFLLVKMRVCFAKDMPGSYSPERVIWQSDESKMSRQGMRRYSGGACALGSCLQPARGLSPAASLTPGGCPTLTLSWVDPPSGGCFL